MEENDELTGEREAEFARSIEAVADHYDADVIAFCGDLFPPAGERFARLIRSRVQKRKNCVLILNTPGGLPREAYKIAHGLQRAYTQGDGHDAGRFIIYVHDYCKSAGTILALGADEIVMSQTAELGPIDVQLKKDDELHERTSGVNIIEAFGYLSDEVLNLFERTYTRLRGQPFAFTAKTASEASASVVTSLFEPIYGQIDPMKLGEIARFVNISTAYGQRLQTENVKPGTVAKLVLGYPSHSFVIDRIESRDLFKSVTKPTDELELIGHEIVFQAKSNGVERMGSPAEMRYVNDEKAIDDEEDDDTEPGPASDSIESRGDSRGKQRKRQEDNQGDD